jgi:hypothetical protein
MAKALHHAKGRAWEIDHFSYLLSYANTNEYQDLNRDVYTNKTLRLYFVQACEVNRQKKPRIKGMKIGAKASSSKASAQGGK